MFFNPRHACLPTELGGVQVLPPFPSFQILGYIGNGYSDSSSSDCPYRLWTHQLDFFLLNSTLYVFDSRLHDKVRLSGMSNEILLPWYVIISLSQHVLKAWKLVLKQVESISSYEYFQEIIIVNLLKVFPFSSISLHSQKEVVT